MNTGKIVPGDLDVWTFTASAGDRIAVHIGEITQTDDFQPWIRLWSPTGGSLGGQSGADAARIEAVAPVSGTYLVLVASADSGVDGSGTYRLTMAHSPGPITVSAGDEGGPLTNGALHSGEIVQGDLDVWTFTASAGDRIAVHIGEISQTDDFQPWIRLWSPTGGSLGSQSGADAAQIEAVAPVSGTYLVLVASADSGVNGSGTYRLTMAHSPGPITVSAGDEGGPLTNGRCTAARSCRATWTCGRSRRALVIGSRCISVRSARRMISSRGSACGRRPAGAWGSQSGADAARIEAVAPVSGTYLVLVASADSGVDGSGTNRLTMAHSPGPITVSAGDEGGPLTNGALHSGEIVQGDLDVWTFTASAGIGSRCNVSQSAETDDFHRGSACGRRPAGAWGVSGARMRRRSKRWRRSRGRIWSWSRAPTAASTAQAPTG